MRIRGEKVKSLGVYVHIPFCISKCPYCDFNSIVASELPEKEYSESILRELASIIEKESIDTKATLLSSIYIGGGTPSLFGPSSMGRILDGIKGSFPLSPLSDEPEVTIEANPETLPGKLKGFREAGCNRLSLGFQSLDSRELTTLGRVHSPEKSLRAFFDAREAGFENIGVDLIFGIPGQRPGDWERTLKGVKGLRPEHISLYSLTIEESTPFHNRYRKEISSSLLPSEDHEVEMYERGIDLLEDGGWLHYEVSNFALPGFSSSHNLRYWSGGDYIGLGAGAHSYRSFPGWGRRWWNARTPYEYMRLVDGTGSAVEGSESLEKADAMVESLFLGLRMLKRGLDKRGFKRRFGETPVEAFKNLTSLEREGFLRSDRGSLFFTRRGLLLSNEVFSNAIPPAFEQRF